MGHVGSGAYWRSPFARNEWQGASWYILDRCRESFPMSRRSAFLLAAVGLGLTGYSEPESEEPVDPAGEVEWVDDAPVDLAAPTTEAGPPPGDDTPGADFGAPAAALPARGPSTIAGLIVCEPDTARVAAVRSIGGPIAKVSVVVTFGGVTYRRCSLGPPDGTGKFDTHFFGADDLDGGMERFQKLAKFYHHCTSPSDVFQVYGVASVSEGNTTISSRTCAGSPPAWLVEPVE